jgi:hypothetical protein
MSEFLNLQMKSKIVFPNIPHDFGITKTWKLLIASVPNVELKHCTDIAENPVYLTLFTYCRHGNVYALY